MLQLLQPDQAMHAPKLSAKLTDWLARVLDGEMCRLPVNKCGEGHHWVHELAPNLRAFPPLAFFSSSAKEQVEPLRVSS